MSVQFNFEGKRFLVTGATSGIGYAVAKRLSQSNARVLMLGRDETKLVAMRDGLENPTLHQTLCLDLAKEFAQLPSLIKRSAAELGSLDGFVHCAGLAFVRPIQIVSEGIIDDLLNITLKSGLMLVKGFCQKGVRSEHGQSSLVFMSSAASITGQKGMSVYSASKAAIDGVVRSLAHELAGQKIRVNSIIAGAIETPMHAKLADSMPVQSLEEYRNKHLLGFGEPDDVASAILFLLSDASKWITGSSMVVDGGYSI